MNWEWEHIIGGIITFVIVALIGWLLYSQNSVGFLDGQGQEGPERQGQEQQAQQVQQAQQAQQVQQAQEQYQELQ